jgi:TPR repeat protein
MRPIRTKQMSRTLSRFLLAAILTLPAAGVFAAAPEKPEEQLAVARALVPAVEDEYDFREVVALYAAAADQGLTIAKYELAELLSVGRSEWADYITAARLYKEAATEGHRDARCVCGWMYSAGMYGQDIDYARAHALMTMGGEDVCTDMEHTITKIEKRMTDADRDRSLDIVEAWIKGDGSEVLDLH